MWNGKTYVAEHDRARILVRDPEPLQVARGVASLGAGAVADFPDNGVLLAGPSGVAVDKRNSIVFVTDDRPWPGSAAAPTPYDVSDYRRWLDQNRPRMFGAAYALPVAGGKVDGASVDVFGKDLRHPSGIAISADGTLYVTEADQHETRWVKFKRGPDCHWAPSGVIAAAKSLDGRVPAFQGIAINRDGTHIYAAGPGGLYIFRSDGTALGRVEFDGPVTGLVWGSCGNLGNSCLYLGVAHSLCRLRTNDTGPDPDQEGVAALPSCQATVNRPPS
jgi:sugar lactone lactonase YvrE